MNNILSHLEHYQGMPVPFFATIRRDGSPDFQERCSQRRKDCARCKLCWICGHRLSLDVVFVGGPRSMETGLFYDGPMHEACAEAALKICPMALATMDYSKNFDSRPYDTALIVLGKVQALSPDSIGLMYSQGFSIKNIWTGDGIIWFFQSYPNGGIRWRNRKNTQGKKGVCLETR